jgi:hypothetical protein
MAVWYARSLQRSPISKLMDRPRGTPGRAPSPSPHGSVGAGPSPASKADRIISNLYPETMPISVTHIEFPASAQSYDALGAPVGCLINPFIATAARTELLEHGVKHIDNGRNLARCSSCQAYLNQFCEVTQFSWVCVLCGHRSGFTRSMVRE